MDHVFWLARIFGPFCLIMGLWMILRSSDLMKIWNSAKSIPALMYFGAVLNLLIGFTILSTYRSWEFGIALLLTLLGYICVFRGLVALFAPEKLVAWSEKAMTMQKQLAYVPIVIGVLLSYMAFFE